MAHMLIRFRVENFRSLRDEQELSFVATPLSDSPEAVVKLTQPNIGVVRVIGIYGANAAGKSTILEAMKYMRDAVLYSQRNWSPEGGVPRNPFVLDSAKRTEPSMFEVDLLLQGTRYRYGFVANSDRVVEEWLFAYPQGRKQRLFIRDVSMADEFSFSRHFPGENKTIQSLTRPNSLFLSAAAQNNHKLIAPIFRWFSYSLAFVDDSNREILWRSTAERFKRPEYKEGILDLIQRADLGISAIDVVDEEVPEKVRSMFRRMFEEQPEILDQLMAADSTPVITLRRSVGEADAAIPFAHESRGTQALFGLSGPVVETLRNGGVLCVDEIDASLHPLMVVELIRLFNDPESNPNNAQLLFNTHDTNILEIGSLRRDQIWFAEKDGRGATQLYPLTDYHARRKENLKRGYLQGRYGAVPLIGASKSLPGLVRRTDAQT